MNPPPPYIEMPSDLVRRHCRALAIMAAERYNIPPAHVTSHIRTVKAVEARREVQRQMLSMGLTRGQVAMAFGCDLRRVRKSAIGGEAPCERGQKRKPQKRRPPTEAERLAQEEAARRQREYRARRKGGGSWVEDWRTAGADKNHFGTMSPKDPMLKACGHG